MIEVKSFSRRINAEDRQHWFELRLTGEMLKDDDLSIQRRMYNTFGEWFENECNGTWAYPTAHLLLFSNEEDKVKVILKYL